MHARAVVLQFLGLPTSRLADQSASDPQPASDTRSSASSFQAHSESLIPTNYQGLKHLAAKYEFQLDSL